MDAKDRPPGRRRGRRIIRICGGLCLVLVVGWVGLWFLGRGLILDRLDRALAAPAEGLEVEFGDVVVAGFPFSYRVTLRDLTATDRTAGSVYRVDAVETRVTADAPDRLVMRLPSRVEATLPGTDLPVRIETEGAVLTVDGLMDAPRRAELQAGALRLTAANAHLDLSDITASLERGRDGMPSRLDGQISRLDWQRQAAVNRGGLDTNGRLTGLRVTGTTTATDASGLRRLFAGGAGRVALDLAAEATRTDLATPAPGQADAERLGLDTGTTEVALAVEDGRLSSAITLQDASLAPDERGAGRNRGLHLARAHAAYDAPAVPTGEMAPFDLRLALDEVRPTGDLLAGLDGTDTPGRLRLALEGMGRIEAGEAGTTRMRLGRLALSDARASGLGASAQAEGQVAVAPDQRHLDGRVEITLDGVLDLLRRLRAAEIIDQGQLQGAATGLALYTVGADAPDRLKSDVVFEGRRIRINGNRVN